MLSNSGGPADYGRPWVPVLSITAAAARVLPRRLSGALLLAGLTGLLPSGSDPDGEWAAALRHTVRHDLARADMVSHFTVAEDIARRQLVRPGRFRRWAGDVVVLRADNDRTQDAKDIPGLRNCWPCRCLTPHQVTG